MNSIYLILMIIIGATGIALIGSIFFCWIPSAHFRKVYHVGVILCEFLFLNFFIAGSILSRIHSGLSMGMLSGALFGICMSIFINLNEMEADLISFRLSLPLLQQYLCADYLYCD